MIFIAAVAIVLALGAYLAGRRFGVLGLALVTGLVVSELWRAELVVLASGLPLEFGVIEPEVLVMLLAALLPSIVVLFGGPKYRTKRGRSFGAVLYGVAGVVVAVSVLGGALLPGSNDEGMLFDLVLQYQQIALTAILAIAIIDVVLLPRSKSEKSTKKH